MGTVNIAKKKKVFFIILYPSSLFPAHCTCMEGDIFCLGILLFIMLQDNHIMKMEVIRNKNLFDFNLNKT